MIPALNLESRVAGVLVPVFALRAEDDLGCGDVRGLHEFIDWAAEAGFRVVQILPVNETGGDHSPYNAISSMALEITTVHFAPDWLPDLPRETFESARTEAQMFNLNEGSVKYSPVKALRWRLMRAAFDRFDKEHLKAEPPTERAAWFQAFRTEHASWLDSYTFFRALVARHGGSEAFEMWPSEISSSERMLPWMASLSEEERTTFERERLFYVYAQWIAWGQWRELKKHAEHRGIALMGDIPIGISYYSAGHFARPRLFESGWSGGAPPEPAFQSDLFVQRWGQNWGVPVYNWDQMARDGFAWWRQRVRGVRDLFHIFRIDHILGFYRIYAFPWRPAQNASFAALSPAEAAEKTGGLLPGFRPRPDDTPENREHNRVQGDLILRALKEAANPAILVGEDLGVVPDYVRPNLTSLGIAGFKVPHWESPYPGGPLMPGAEYPRLSVTTWATHDHDPLRAMWERWEIAARAVNAGDESARPVAEEGGRESWRITEWAGVPEPERHAGWSDSLHEKLIEGLLATNSWLAVLMITDLLGTSERFNLPGVASSDNWSTRLAHTAQGMREDPAIAAKIGRVRELIHRTGRAG